GSNEGNTAAVADQLKEILSGMGSGHQFEVRNFGEAIPSDLEEFDHLILGIPTWNIGELQDDWDAFYYDMESLNLRGKKIAIFGLGDQYGYSDSFLDGVGMIGEEVIVRGGELIGQWPVDGYEFTQSLALDIDTTKFMGLAIDQDNEVDKTPERLKTWASQILPQFN
ncbi:MAG: flavodoxin, partial [Anaerolineae bacterium]